MIAQFSVWPLDSLHMSHDAEEMADILTLAGVEFRLGPVGTTIEGEWEEVMHAVRLCHEALRAKHDRVLTSLMIDDNKVGSTTLAEADEKLNQIKQKAS